MAIDEHHRVVAGLLDAVGTVGDPIWHLGPTPTRWSAAALTLHVADAYRYGADAARGRATMRVRVPRVWAWFARTVLLPRLLAAERFPAGARSPDEVLPDLARAATLTKPDGLSMLQQCADDALSALIEAHDTRPKTRIVHASFGSLSPLLALRLLSAHTRHHTAGMRERSALTPRRAGC